MFENLIDIDERNQGFDKETQELYDVKVYTVDDITPRRVDKMYLQREINYLQERIIELQNLLTEIENLEKI